MASAPQYTPVEVGLGARSDRKGSLLENDVRGKRRPDFQSSLRLISQPSPEGDGETRSKPRRVKYSSRSVESSTRQGRARSGRAAMASRAALTTREPTPLL